MTHPTPQTLPSSTACHPDLVTVYDSLVSDIQRLQPDCGTWFPDYAKNQKARLIWDLDYLQTHILKEGQKIADIASAPFLLTGCLHKQGRDVVGTDIHPERFAKALEGLQLTIDRCNIETTPLPYADQSLDVVIFNEIFEHLRLDLIFTLSEIRRVLKPDGVLYLTTPNLFAWRRIRRFLTSGWLGPAVYPEYKKLHDLGHMGHVREYAAPEVIDFMKACGFTVKLWQFRYRPGKNAQNLRRIPPFYKLFPFLRPDLVFVFIPSQGKRLA